MTFVDYSGYFPLIPIIGAVVVVAAAVGASIVAGKQETERVETELNSLPPPSIDITDELNAAMNENVDYLINFQKENGLMATDLEFKEKVKTGGQWDYKQYMDKSITYGYKGLVLEAQDVGNINYGYVGASMGFTNNTLLRMAGLVQTNRKWQMYFVLNGDDLRDQMYILYGIGLYRKGGV